MKALVKMVKEHKRVSIALVFSMLSSLLLVWFICCISLNISTTNNEMGEALTNEALPELLLISAIVEDVLIINHELWEYAYNLKGVEDSDVFDKECEECRGSTDFMFESIALTLEEFEEKHDDNRETHNEREIKIFKRFKKVLKEYKLQVDKVLDSPDLDNILKNNLEYLDSLQNVIAIADEQNNEEIKEIRKVVDVIHNSNDDADNIIIVVAGITTILISIVFFVSTRTVLTVFENERQSKRELEISKSKYKGFLEGSPDIVWVSDLNGRLSYTSPSVERIRGFKVDEVLGHSLESMLTPKSVELVRKEIKKVLSVDFSEKDKISVPRRVMELEHTCKDGSTVWMEVHMSLIFDEDGELFAVTGVSRDITEKMELSHEKATNQSLKAVLITAGSVCHEANQPLQSLMGTAELMKMMDDDLPPRARKYLKIIEEQIRRLASITRKLQGIKRVETMWYPSQNKNGRILDLDASSFSDTLKNSK